MCVECAFAWRACEKSVTRIAYVRTYVRTPSGNRKGDERTRKIREKRKREKHMYSQRREKGENIEGLADLCASAVDRKSKFTKAHGREMQGEEACERGELYTCALVHAPTPVRVVAMRK